MAADIPPDERVSIAAVARASAARMVFAGEADAGAVDPGWTFLPVPWTVDSLLARLEAIGPGSSGGT